MRYSLIILFSLLASVLSAKDFFGPFELGGRRQNRIKLGIDETAEVKKAVDEIREDIRVRTGVTIPYSVVSSPMFGDMFISAQPWAAKGAWFVRLKNNILAIHGSDESGVLKALAAFREKCILPAKSAADLRWEELDLHEGPQPSDVFDAEVSRVTKLQEGNRDWENECVTDRNRRPARADGFPLARVEDALGARSVSSPYVKSLNGVWKISWAGSPKLRVRDFWKTDFDDSEWLTIEVPSCVEMKGFGSPGYVNMQYPHMTNPPYIGDEYNPVSSYRTRFDVPEGWKDRRVILRFDGVYSAYYVWVNGKKVGYAEDSCLPSEFDVTPYVNADGKGNLLAVEVYRWSDGSYLEDQDFLRYSGIYRGVSIWAEPKQPIRDYFVTTDLVEDFKSAVVRVKADADAPVSAALYDAGGQKVGEGLSIALAEPHLWSAETPYLYTLVLQSGEDIRSCKVGLRHVILNDRGQVIINGREVKAKGVNRHDSSPWNGRALTREEIETDIRLIKQGNFDTIRTSHYPNDPYFYDLCDQYGIYVQCEANVESHGMNYGWKSLAYPPSWAKTTTERCVRMVEFFKNHPSIYLWSLGNEAGTGYNYEVAVREMRAIDTTRLYMNRNDNENFRLQGGGYQTLEELRRLATWGPYHMSEYAHGMGNSMGNFREYWDVFRECPSISGGCMWDWYDQTVRVETDRIGPDGKRVGYWAYGADWDERPNDANFCVNGVIGPRREWSAKLIEVAHVQQDLEVVCSDAATGRAKLINRAAFTDADAYEGRWAFFADGVEVEHGALQVPHLGPQSVGTIELTKPRVKVDSRAECFYRVSFHLKDDRPWASKGWEVAHNQLAFGPAPRRVSDPVNVGVVRVVEARHEIVVWAGPTEATFSRETGTLSNLRMNGKTILADEQGICRGPRLTCQRAFTDNDNGVRKNFYDSGLTQLRYHARPVKVERAEDGAVVIRCTVEVTGSKSAAFSHEQAFTFRGDGSIEIANVSMPRGKMPQLPRLGLSLVLDSSLENFRYYGRGPWENYIDRCTASDIACWKSTVTDQYVEYTRPQDNGYKTAVRWAALLDGDGDGVLVRGSEPLCVQALHYAMSELELQRHRGAGSWTDATKERFYAPMFPRAEVMLNLDLRQLGLGNGSCGPQTLECYTFPNRREVWSVTLVPVRNANEKTLNEAARRIPQTIPDEPMRRSLRASGDGFDGA